MNNKLLLLEARLARIEKILNENKAASIKKLLRNAGIQSTKIPLDSNNINELKKYLDDNQSLITLAQAPNHALFQVNGQKPKVAKCLRSETDLNYVYINVSDIPQFAKLCSKLQRGIKDYTFISRALSHAADNKNIENVKQIKGTFLIKYLNERPIIPIQYTNKLCEIFSEINTKLKNSGTDYRIGFSVYAGKQPVSNRYHITSNDMKFEDAAHITSLKVIIYTPKKKRNTDENSEVVSILIDRNFIGKGYSKSDIVKPVEIKELFSMVENDNVRTILNSYYPAIKNIVETDIEANKEANSRADVDGIYAIQIHGDLPHFICYIEQNDNGYKLVSADRDSDYVINSNGITKL